MGRPLERLVEREHTESRSLTAEVATSPTPAARRLRGIGRVEVIRRPNHAAIPQLATMPRAIRRGRASPAGPTLSIDNDYSAIARVDQLLEPNRRSPRTRSSRQDRRIPADPSRPTSPRTGWAATHSQSSASRPVSNAGSRIGSPSTPAERLRDSGARSRRSPATSPTRIARRRGDLRRVERGPSRSRRSATGGCPQPIRTLHVPRLRAGGFPRDNPLPVRSLCPRRPGRTQELRPPSPAASGGVPF